jgi:malate dehydrogenase (oxaloacetate-decarboxylating)(NADP+)
MVKITKEAALSYHETGRPGKIEVKPTKPYHTQTDLSLAYSPGVAFPCLEIQQNPDDAYKYTDKGNLVAVISNGTAVLGLGDIGAMSGKPVMEGKGLLFKIYGGVDVFDIEIDEKDPEKFCETVEKIAPTFGGINLEDIKAPQCFYIEERLKRTLDIPVMHDDQHGTAIISAAGLKNALEVAGKNIADVKIVVNGAGAAAISCTKLYVALGAQVKNIVMLDSKGVITSDRENLTEQKKLFATDRRDVHTLEEAVKGADVFVGLSKGNVLSKDMIRSMADNPIVFALANPVPEISYEDAMDSRPDVLMSTGRSDYPNQINNVIGFPYIPCRHRLLPDRGAYEGRYPGCQGMDLPGYGLRQARSVRDRRRFGFGTGRGPAFGRSSRSSRRPWRPSWSQRRSRRASWRCSET